MTERGIILCGVATGLLGHLACNLGSHPCITNSDDDGVWGECVRCHARFGYVERSTLRAYAEAEARGFTASRDLSESGK